MSNDSFRKVTHQSWFSRIGGAIKGIFVGFVLVIIAFPVLFFNEGNAVKTAKSLEEGASIVVSLDSPTLTSANDGTLVHLSGEAKTEEVLTDPIFNIGANAIAFRRTVEMYQWHEDTRSETRNKIGGGTETVTTYNYRKGWAERAIDSRRFERPGGHENPDRMPYDAHQALANHVQLGDFVLTRSLLTQMKQFEPLLAAEDLVARLPNDIRERSKIDNGRVYIGQNPNAPEVGDVRVSFSVVKPKVVSVIAQQNGNTFEPFKSKHGRSIELLYEGTHSAENMFASEQEKNVIFTWVLRFVGIIMMFIGFALIFRPLSVFADVLPFMGSLVRLGTGLVAGALTITLSFTTIAIGWLAYRPLVAIALFVVVGGVIVGVIKLLKDKKKAQGTAS